MNGSASQLVQCPACCNDDPDILLNADGLCRYCDGTGTVSELAAAEWEVALLQVRCTKLEAENAAERRAAHALRQVAQAAKRWRDNPCDRTERELCAAVDSHEDVVYGKAA